MKITGQYWIEEEIELEDWAVKVNEHCVREENQPPVSETVAWLMELAYNLNLPLHHTTPKEGRK